ncbi:MAG: diphthine--ammonia ligase [Cytophagales bacterium]|nr:diphthine--ammonia ligase [Bernardetiaceae bacterium]MDW8211751.1 diphthine--ammonia ligase [Cytophagales bacterium]
MEKILLSWSGGKDSALALYLLKKQQLEVEGLLTCINAHCHRITMHGVRQELLYQQALSLGIPLHLINLPENPTNLQYEQAFREQLTYLKTLGFSRLAFGDIFLQDLRQYREQLLQPLSIEAIFPLWGKNTFQLIEHFLNLGFKAIVVCANASLLDKSFVGRVIDKNFVKELPKNVDVCGENGEFHTFCYDGPLFCNPVKFVVGQTVLRQYQQGNLCSSFWFCDLLPYE